jgi:pantoate--beta-alanine ligase
MQIVRTISEVRSHVAEARKAGRRIGFVPTMGYLHQGHLSLVEESKKHTQYQAMSIFVNRIQFNDPKDFAAYPVDLERDFALAKGVGVDLVFVPDENEMYKDNLIFVDMELLTKNLCGAHRPGHFREKDIQQAVCIEKMAADLDFPVKIIIAPTVREKDGLAMSSRNKRLSEDERTRALAISKSLRAAEEMITLGERSGNTITAVMKKILDESRPAKIDYISVVRYRDLDYTEAIEEKSVIAVAAYYGETRLIDNMIVEISGGKAGCMY